MITGQQTNLCLDLRDRFNTQLRSVHASMRGASSKSIGTDALDGFETTLAGHVTRLRDLKALWLSRPHRGERPEIRVIITANLDSRGGLNIRWDPSADNKRDSRALKDLSRSEFGGAWNVVSIPGVAADGEATLAPLARAAFMVPDMLASAMTSEAATHVATSMDLTIGNEIEIHDTETIERTEIEKGLSALQDMPWISVAEALQADLRGTTPEELRKACLRLQRAAELDYHEAARALSLVRRARLYNDAWWRTAAKFELPQPRSLRRRAKPGRKLVRVSGSKARHSSIAPRGTEGKRIVARGHMKSSIRDRMLSKQEDWAFTAGDFADFARASDRKRIMTALEALRREGVIRSVAKGIYCRADGQVSDHSALNALMRDRGEFCAPGMESALAGLTTGQPAHDFFMSGRLRAFRVSGRIIRLHREPVRGLCEAASRARSPSAVVAIVLHLTGAHALPGERFRQICENFPEEHRLSVGISGYMI
ncbi:hypothetical protein [Salipiger mucosus]|uniref:Type IV toxin-antitoxin system AbiEi family antitoxin domain-containing protein n=1 Tax=Salipiger mucosus DSM 16094 TaxID=1123237 RepID=S9QRE1_9RHOB|nr:hypothetical protein [Salipiger mucosus]EPX83966.1 hypothetical protein Salmuc_01741 [Salipiger mucosus DSM 16094]